MMIQYNALEYPYASKRTVMFARRGMVASSQPLAAQAGLDMLKQGGNAVDAAVSAAACLTVVEPTSNGIGSDAFALLWCGGSLHGLNSSGPAPQAISIDAMKKLGYEKMPKHGWLPVTVPGAPAAWAELISRFGKLSLSQVLSPAVSYARYGFPVSPVTCRSWRKTLNMYKSAWAGEEFSEWFNTFSPEGRAPEPGELWKSSGHADTLEQIADTSARSFYEGETAEKIDAASRAYGGCIRYEDLAGFSPEWVNPISVNYRGYDVWELPPNGQGLVALMALQMLSGYDFTSMDTARRFHLQIEAIKLAFADGLKQITQQDAMHVSVEDLLSPEYAQSRSACITEQASQPVAGEPKGSGTVYLAAADGEGNMVSFIQSNYMGFGSGIVVPGTGISLQNRGETFSLDRDHANCLEPGKRTYHTIIPGFLTRNGIPVGPFGVMGGFMQPQGHVQVMMNSLDDSLNPQSALDAPRWQWVRDKEVLLEDTVDQKVFVELKRRGHDVKTAEDVSTFGRGQIIWRDHDTGVLAGGTEPRTDGTIASW